MDDRAPPRNSAWSNLPTELLSTIAKSLTVSPIDILSFRSVCNSWHDSFPSSPKPPFLSPLLPLIIPIPPFALYRRPISTHSSLLSLTSIYSLHLPRGLSSLAPTTSILFLDEFTPGKLSLRKPFSNQSYSGPITFPKSVNLVEFNRNRIGRFYSLSFSVQDGFGKPGFCSEDVGKVILFPNNLGVLVLFDGKLAMICLDLGNYEVGQGRVSDWLVIHDGDFTGFRFDDIVEFKGRVLGVDRKGRVYELDCRLGLTLLVVSRGAGGGGRRKRLVESFGGLFLVVMCNAGETDKGKAKFKVYELDEAGKKWVKINSLGDRSFLFGPDFSFSASGRDLGTCGKNCILFKKESFQSYNKKNDDGVLFEKLDNSDLCVGVCHLNDADNFSAIDSYPEYADMLWPPPPWLWSIDRLERLVILETTIVGIRNRIPENIKTKIKEQTTEVEQAILEAAGLVLKLKEVVIKFQEGEKKFMNPENNFQEAMSMDGLETIHNLDQIDCMLGSLRYRIDCVLAEAKTSSDGTVERFGCVEEFQTAPEPYETGQGPPSHSIRRVLRRCDALLFQLEECVSEMETFQKARLVSVLTE